MKKREMYNILAKNMSLAPKKTQATKPTSTISKPPLNESDDTNFQQDTPNFSLNLAADNVDLIDLNLEDYHDQVLVDYLNQNEQQLMVFGNSNTDIVKTVSTTMTMQTIHNNTLSNPLSCLNILSKFRQNKL